MENFWSILTKTILIGQNSFSSTSHIIETELLELEVSASKKNSVERNLLLATAIASKLNQAAAKIQLSTSTISAQNNASSFVNVHQKTQIEHCLINKQPTILLEILHLIIKQNQELPYSTLPSLLSIATKNKLLTGAVQQCMGQRGNWLCAMNDDWKNLLEVDLSDESLFTHGSFYQRIAYIKALRKQNPALCIQILEQSWASEDFSSKAAFIACLEGKLSQNDEVFLENCLQDSRKQVRDASIHLLSKLPESRLVKRMIKIASKLIIFNSKNTNFEIQLPPSFTMQMKNDGIEANKKYIKNQGPKANQLAQIISKIPVNYWSQITYKNPTELLQIVAKTDWFGIFVWGWAKSAIEFNNNDWQKEIHLLRILTHYKYDWASFSLDFMFEDLDDTNFNAITKIYLGNFADNMFQSDTPILELLLQEYRVWDLELTTKVMANIYQIMTSKKNVLAWHLKSLLKKAAVSAHPLWLKQHQHIWKQLKETNLQWQQDLERMLETLQFRLEIHTLPS